MPCPASARITKLLTNLIISLNTRRFVRGRGTDNQESIGPSFHMVARSRAHEEQKYTPYYQRVRLFSVFLVTQR